MLAFLIAIALTSTAPSPAVAAPAPSGDLTGVIRDSTSGQPLAGGEVIVFRSGQIVARTETDPLGRYRIHNLPDGEYDVEVRLLGFAPVRSHVSIGPEGETDVSLRLSPSALRLQELATTAPVPVAVDTRSGNQVFKQDSYHGAPTQTTSQIVQQSVAGAARAPTGEVHIRGQHAEYTYYIDGIPVPAGISGSLNEVFDPDVVNQITFQTGGWDAEFGNKNAAIVDVNTRIPAGGFRADASGYGGSFTSNGQTVDASQNIGKFGWFVSGTRRETDMRQEPVLFDTLSRDPINFHNHGTDLFGFGKAQYLPSSNDVVSLDANWSRTRFEVPFDSTGGVLSDDHQQDMNSFVNLGWRHQFPGTGTASGSDLFVGAFHRRGSLNFTPGANDTPSFVFFPDTNTAYNLSEDRNFNSTGIKADYAYRFSERLQFKFGGLASFTRGHEDFVTLDASGNPGPASISDLKGNDEWIYAQTVIAPTEKWELRTGVRYDNHEAPFAGSQHQVSPRVKLSFFPDAQTSLWAYYGRLFIPTNVEDLRAITSVAQGGVVAQPTLPERDDFFEIGLTHRFPAGIVAKLSAYHKRSSPGIDDNTVPGSTIITSVNIDQVRINGIETVLEIRPPGRLSGYLNLALNHAYGLGPITGGFFPAESPAGYFDLDHDQRLSGVAAMNYADKRLFATVTGLYGSGLTNGEEPDAATYGRGLFDFNQSIHVDPNFILNASAGYLLDLGSVLLRPEVYVDNLLNHKYLLKGAFFSGASVGRPRTVQVRLNLGM
ncbi:MAG: TonB-dependent receptor domain-containing protein [Gemmatimonadales bacterium]